MGRHHHLGLARDGPHKHLWPHRAAPVGVGSGPERKGSTMTDIRLTIEDLHKTYPPRGRKDPGTEVLRGVNLEVHDGEFLSIVGPSGAGKTTLLRCISGLLAPTSGRVLLDDQEFTAPPREIALVFQDYSRSLYPWMNVGKNIALPLRAQGLDKGEIAKRVESCSASVGLEGAAGRYPWQLLLSRPFDKFWDC